MFIYLQTLFINCNVSYLEPATSSILTQRYICSELDLLLSHIKTSSLFDRIFNTIKMMYSICHGKVEISESVTKCVKALW